MPQPSLTTSPSNTRTLFFIFVLSFGCALILSVLASVLKEPQEIAKDLYRSTQMMMAAKILDSAGHFQLPDPNHSDKYIPAKYQDGFLIPSETAVAPTNAQLLEIYKKRLIPYLTDNHGNLHTFEEAHLNENEYLADFRKKGYYTQPLKLLYAILPNKKPVENTEQKEEQPIGYVIPVNGFGLWDAIYGYLAIKNDGNTVIGISWYDQKETPGLGGNISTPEWQNLFPGKHIFQENANGTTDFKTAQLGIIVVRGKVSDVLGISPKAKSAVDGMTGATLTGNGVTKAYQDVLSPYRPFLIKLHQEWEKGHKGKTT